jgi:hypothetical protein
MNIILLAGPKTYSAKGSVQDDHHQGSTRLHKDLTDTVNIMLWEMPASHGPSCALWDIFPAAASHIVDKFLIEQGSRGPGSATLSQQIYVTPANHELLFKQYGIRPWTILQ